MCCKPSGEPPRCARLRTFTCGQRNLSGRVTMRVTGSKLDQHQLALSRFTLHLLKAIFVKLSEKRRNISKRHSHREPHTKASH